MDISIIIVSWNTRDLLADCLASIYLESFSLDVEIFVVDNASIDGTPAMVRQRFPGVKLIENATNAGFARANNQAMQQSCGRYVLLLNSDTHVGIGALQSLIDFADAHPNVGAAGARLLNADGSLQISCHPMLTPARELWRLMFFDAVIHLASYPPHWWQSRQPRRVDVIKGACLLLRRAALDQIGLLDESYFMYTEEVDLCCRLAQAGWELWWVPESRVIHYGEASSRQMQQEMYIQLYRSKVHFYRKFGGPPRADLFKMLVRMVYWPRFAVARSGAIFAPVMGNQAALFRRLLLELPSM